MTRLTTRTDLARAAYDATIAAAAALGAARVALAVREGDVRVEHAAALNTARVAYEAANAAYDAADAAYRAARAHAAHDARVAALNQIDIDENPALSPGYGQS